MKVFKYLFISSIMFAVTSCGNDWLDLAPSTQWIQKPVSMFCQILNSH